VEISRQRPRHCFSFAEGDKSLIEALSVNPQEAGHEGECEFMLQMRCPECNGVISSPFLAELSSFECTQCKKTVDIKDVYVTTKGLTIYREDLPKHIYRFQKLLREIDKERNLLAKDDKKSSTTKEGIDQLEGIIKELLDGARNNFRIEFSSDSTIGIEFGSIGYSGKLINLSSEGASISLEKIGDLPSNRSDINLKIQLPTLSTPLSVKAKIVWSRKLTEKEQFIFGVKFVEIDENARSAIWNFIVETASVPLPRHSSPGIDPEKIT
jgi:hypothetical protein